MEKIFNILAYITFVIIFAGMIGMAVSSAVYNTIFTDIEFIFMEIAAYATLAFVILSMLRLCVITFIDD